MKVKLLRKLRKRAKKYVSLVQMADGKYGIMFCRGDIHPVNGYGVETAIIIVEKLRRDEIKTWVRNLRKHEMYIKRIVH